MSHVKISDGFSLSSNQQGQGQFARNLTYTSLFVIRIVVAAGAMAIPGLTVCSLGFEVRYEFVLTLAGTLV